MYQLKHADVKRDDYNDPTQARLILQMDLENDIRSLVNFEYDQNLNAYQGTKKVIANNLGIEHQLRIDQDAFGNPKDQIKGYGIRSGY